MSKILDTVRPVVAHFAVAMENTLQLHDSVKGPSGWKELRLDQLHDMIAKQLKEIQEEQHDPEMIAARAADIGNLSMMIWDNSCDKARRKLYGENPV